MTVASKLQMLAAIKAAQYEAIIAKGGTLSPGDWSAYAAAIAAIPSGGGVPAIIANMPFTAGAEPLGGTVWYVRPGGAGDRDGRDWDNAFATRQEAINAASYGDHIRVWEGQYYLSTVQTPKAGVSEYYGFNGDGSWATRQPFTKPSKLDAGFTANTFVNDSVTFLDEQIIDGMWIQNGRVTGDGGGMNLVNKTHLRNGIILNNNATVNGGGVCMSPSSTASNCIIANNNGNLGGGVYTNSSNTASNCIIVNNTSYRGGGIYLNSWSTASNCIIANNFGSNIGGGAYLSNYCTASNCIIANNNTSSGGAGGAYATFSNTISNCIIANNYALSGGGVHLNNSCRAINTTCINNTAPTGDNFYVANSNILYNCCSWGGNIYLASANYAYKIYNCASNFALTGVANWDAIADVRNFLPLSAFPFKAPGTSPFDGSGVFMGVNTLGRTEYALEYINSMILPKLVDAHLPAGSPLIGAGYYEAGVTPDTDADGKERPITPSIGAYEP